MIVVLSSLLVTRNAMSLSGMNPSGSVSHLSSELLSHITPDFRIDSEYGNDGTLAAARPNTPRRRGPILSLSREWHPVQRFSKSSLPWLLPATRGRTAHKTHVTNRALASAKRTAAE